MELQNPTALELADPNLKPFVHSGSGGYPKCSDHNEHLISDPKAQVRAKTKSLGQLAHIRVGKAYCESCAYETVTGRKIDDYTLEEGWTIPWSQSQRH